MRNIRDISIKTKLKVLLGLGCAVTLLLAVVAFVVNDIRMIKSHMVHQSKALTETLGANSVTALLFDDSEVANEVLSSLRLQPSVQSACTFDAAGNIVAVFGAQENIPVALPELDQPAQVITAARYLEVFKPIIHNEQRLGTIYLRASTDELRNQLGHYALIVAMVMIAALVTSIAMGSLLQRIISRPIIRLVDAMALVSANGDYALEVQKEGDDELGALCDRFNEMLQQIQKRDADLKQLHLEFLETARKAGMAEIATGVLHNVGNVLNSVNISSALVAKQVRKSRISHLANAVDLMEQHADDLGTFITQDKKGKRIPAFLRQLADQLSEEQKSTLKEIEDLDLNIQHIKDIVRMQQSYAGVAGIVEKCQPADLMSDAWRMTGSSLERHGIKVVRDFEELPATNFEKAKLLQIFVNLIKNAKDAMREVADKELTLTVKTHGEDRVQFVITDNGSGIAEENLTAIFSHGFTTKQDGHGFGLHTAANAAMEMGGSLAAYSDGPGKGATFVVELPMALEPEAVAV